MAVVEERLRQEGLQPETLIQMAEEVLHLLASALPDPTAATATAEALRKLFAAEKYGVAATWRPDVPATSLTEADDEVWLTMEPTHLETQLFSYAISVTVTARFGVEHPLGDALGSDTQLRELARRFREATPDATLELNGPEVLRLYLSLHILTLLCLADLQPLLLARLTPAPNAPAPWTAPGQQQHLVESVSRHVAILNQLLDEYFADEPAYQAAQAEVHRLAELP